MDKLQKNLGSTNPDNNKLVVESFLDYIIIINNNDIKFIINIKYIIKNTITIVYIVIFSIIYYYQKKPFGHFTFGFSGVSFVKQK